MACPIVYDSLQEIVCKILDTAHRGVRTQQRRIVTIYQSPCPFDLTWKKVSKPHRLETRLSVLIVSPSPVGVTIETVNGDYTIAMQFSSLKQGNQYVLVHATAKPYSTFESFGAASTVRPMKSRSMLTLRPASTLPFRFKTFFALDWDWKVTVATSEESLAESCGHRDIFDVATVFRRSRKS